MGKLYLRAPLRSLLVVGTLVVGIVPVTSVTATQPAEPESRPRPPMALPITDDVLDPQRPRAGGFFDDTAKLSLTPPPGWVLAPATSLNPLTNPASDVHEVARFQLRIGDPALYAQPIPVTSGLIQDAGAVLSVGLAREGSDLLDLDVDPRALREELRAQHGFVTFDEDATYDGLVTYTRYYVARETERRIVIEAVVPAGEWPQLRTAVLAAMASLRAEQVGPHGPVAQLPPEPVAVAEPEPAPAATAAEPPPDPTAARRGEIIERARSLLGLPYVWGGNNTARGMDCSAYISWTWGLGRYTTDSLGSVSHFIGKDELRPGDIMNLPTWNDPARYGHVRMFAAWANEARSLVWVYEETPPRAVHRVIAYDARYQPMRLNGLGSGGAAPLVVAPPSAVEVAVPSYGPAAQPRQQANPRPAATPRPTVRPATPKPVATPRPTARPATPKPVVTPRPGTVTQPAATLRPGTTATPRPAPTATPKPVVTPKPVATVRAATAAPVRPLATPRPAAPQTR